MRALGRFWYERHVAGFTISPRPLLDHDGLAYFTSVIASASVYLEYGGGGSTLVALQNAQLVLSVESDRSYMDSLQRAINELPSRASYELIHANIGFTQLWGNPIFKTVTPARLIRWRGYVKAPWERLRKKGVEPDMIFIDGRFRVACCLESLMNLSRDSACKILVDDYAERPWLKPIEQFGDLVGMHGRMAVFRKNPDMDQELCRRALEASYADFR